MNENLRWINPMLNSLYFTNENISGVSSAHMNSTQVVAAKRISYLWRVTLVMPVEYYFEIRKSN